MNNGQITFKSYSMEQMSLLPPSLEELIPEHHLVRVVNRVVEELEIEPLMAKYKGGGTSSYHPRMMLKVIVYAYTQKIYSSRKIEKALWENIGFMWISGGNRPDFHTINNFRSDTMKEVVRKVFASLRGRSNGPSFSIFRLVTAAAQIPAWPGDFDSRMAT